MQIYILIHILIHLDLFLLENIFDFLILQNYTLLEGILKITNFDIDLIEPKKKKKCLSYCSYTSFPWY